MFFSQSPCLSYLTPADPWLPPFSVIPFEGPVGDSSHLEEVLNHNIFSGSSWECVVIKERGWRSSWRSVLLWPLRSVWSRCRIHSFPVYPARVARPDTYSIQTYIYFIFFLQLVRFSLIQDKTLKKNSPKVKGQFSIPSPQGALAQRLLAVISMKKTYSSTCSHRCKLDLQKIPVALGLVPKSWRCCSVSGGAVYSWKKASSSHSRGIPFPLRPDREAINNLLKSALMRN